MHVDTLAGPQRPALLAAVISAAIAAGLFGLYGYVHQYMLYRGFGPPTPTVAPALRGRIVPLDIVSRALGNRKERILVYLPTGYATHPQRRYPVLYLLHGTPGSPTTAYVNSLHVGPRMDLLIHGACGRSSSRSRPARREPTTGPPSGQTARRPISTGSRT